MRIWWEEKTNRELIKASGTLPLTELKGAASRRLTCCSPLALSLLPSLPHLHTLEVVKDFIRCGFDNNSKVPKATDFNCAPNTDFGGKMEPITAGSALKEKKKETPPSAVTLCLLVLYEKKIKKLSKMSELTYRFRLLTGEILPSGWAVCPHEKETNKKKSETFFCLLF